MRCKVNILNGIEMWKNVTYKIDWFAEGKLLYSESRCDGLPVGAIHNNPCPGGEIESKLTGEKYKLGQWVRSHDILHYFRIVSLILQCIFKQRDLLRKSITSKFV